MSKRLARFLILSMTVMGLVFAKVDILTNLEQLFAGSGSPAPTIVKAAGTIEVAFSPNNGVTAAVVRAIGEAQQTILVAAYSFTSRDIAAALLQAKKRGVDIRLILDKTQASQKYSSSSYFANQGFDQRIDIKHAIYHDKVMIIDDKTVITGSFNFTKAAETKNAENLLILRNNPELAKLYTRDWWHNWQLALPRNEFILKQQAKSRKQDDDE